MTQIPRTGKSDTAITASLPVCPECDKQHDALTLHAKGCPACDYLKKQGRKARDSVTCGHKCHVKDCRERQHMDVRGFIRSEFCKSHHALRDVPLTADDLGGGYSLFERTKRIGAIGGPTGEPHV